MTIIDQTGKVPYSDKDDTRAWVEAHRDGGKIKPNLVLRIATDTNYILNQKRLLSAYGRETYTQAVMNIALPGQSIPHVLNWQVNESMDNPVQTASFECLNVLGVSDITTTMVTGLAADYHDLTITASYAGNSLGVVTKVAGNVAVDSQVDQDGYPFDESNVKYRTFQEQVFGVSSTAGWPDCMVPTDADGNDVAATYGSYMSATGTGSIFVLIDNEIIRVSKISAGIFYILPGGRAINGRLEAHSPGATVTLLGMRGSKGRWAGVGYLTPDDFKPYKSLLRPGTCLVSYEGYGTFPSSLVHTQDPNSNYIFTGYWFVKGLESTLGEDMVPRIRVDLVNVGELFNQQKITPDLVQRIRTQFGQWLIGGSTIWGVAGANRDIPGDWVDFNSWDPTLKDSYPLKIKTQYAQHKEFFDHMRETNFGVDCEICQQERKEWLSTHAQNPDDLRTQWAAMPAGKAKTDLGQRIADLTLSLDRAIGRHIYKQSIRVITEDAGPVKTYIRLMGTMAAAAWDHPAYGTELAQRFTKIPNSLFTNIRDIYSGLVYNGQVDFTLGSAAADAAYKTMNNYSDSALASKRQPLTCPFESTYDKAPFYQPMQELAEANGNRFWVNRDGKPVFMPPNFPFRPYGTQTTVKAGQKWEYFLRYGGSISSYSHSLNTDGIITQCWVTAQTAFEGTSFTVPSAGTGFSKEGTRIIYSPLGGNKEGLALTSGVQQVETISVDNQTFGLQWNTEPRNWGVTQIVNGDNTQVINALPPLYDGSPEIGYSTKYTGATKRVQQTINFFLIRRYLPAVSFNSKFYYTIYEDGNYGRLTEKALVELQNYLIGTLPSGERPTALANIQQERDAKNYGRDTYLWLVAWLHSDTMQITTSDGRVVNAKTNNFIKTDIWWYVYNGREWTEYVAAVTGLQVPVKSVKAAAGVTRTSLKSLETPLYVIDEKGLQQNVSEWMKTYTRSVVNIGNRTVDDSINKASVRSLSCNLADPRIQPGDVLWCEVPGHLAQENVFGNAKPPFTNGICVTTASRQMDLTTGTYTATYSGYRYRGDFAGDGSGAVSSGFDFT